MIHYGCFNNHRDISRFLSVCHDIPWSIMKCKEDRDVLMNYLNSCLTFGPLSGLLTDHNIEELPLVPPFDHPKNFWSPPPPTNRRPPLPVKNDSSLSELLKSWLELYCLTKAVDNLVPAFVVFTSGWLSPLKDPLFYFTFTCCGCSLKQWMSSGLLPQAAKNI